MSYAILILNSGSSSIKFALFERGERQLAHGRIEDLGSGPHLLAYAGEKLVGEKRWRTGTHESFFRELLGWAESHLAGRKLVAVGHRIVHGGEQFVAPCRLTRPILGTLRKLEPLAPLHQPHNLAAIAAVWRLRPDIVQVGCFDTAFHHTLSPTARRFGLPRSLEQAGVRRYGFHGLSYEFIARRLREIAPESPGGRILVAHLGNGASLCALKDGRSVDTSMGFSALDGLVMGTRCGTLDPGVLLYLMRKGLNGAALEDLLYSRSGLLGVSGESADMRALLASKSHEAAEAIDLFVFRAAREAAAMVASMGGLDGIVFTAGIGANAPDIRRRICERLGWLGLELAQEANSRNALEIQGPGSRVRAWVIPTDEELVIARHTFPFVA